MDDILKKCSGCDGDMPKGAVVCPSCGVEVEDDAIDSADLDEIEEDAIPEEEEGD